MMRLISCAVLALLLFPASALAQVVQKPAIYFTGSQEYGGATLTEEVRKRLAVVFTLNPDAPRRWGVIIGVQASSPLSYSVTYVDNCNGRWCWRTTLTGVCSLQIVQQCAESIFNHTLAIVNATPEG